MTPGQQFDQAAGIILQDRRNLIAFLGRFSEGQARWRPPGGEWSILEGLEHIMREEWSFRANFLDGLRGAGATGAWDNAPDPVVKLSWEAMRRREQGPSMAPAHLHPVGEGTWEGMRAALWPDRAATREVLLPYRPRDLGRLIVFMSKRLGHLNGYDRIVYCGIHDFLHQDQMARAARQPGFPRR
ncbi:MAG: DinB family protein [Nitrospinota bacterium]